MLVLLNFVLPLFCISLVSGPAEEEEGLGKRNKESASGLLPSPQTPGHQSGRETQAGWPGGLSSGLQGVALIHGTSSHPAFSAARRLTCEDDQPEAPLGVPQHAAPQQHVLVAQGELALLPVERSTEFVQLVVGRLADHLT